VRRSFEPRDRLVELAARYTVPTIYAWREFPIAGALTSIKGTSDQMLAASKSKGTGPPPIPSMLYTFNAVQQS